jgi:hypothetical protein
VEGWRGVCSWFGATQERRPSCMLLTGQGSNSAEQAKASQAVGFDGDEMHWGEDRGFLVGEINRMDTSEVASYEPGATATLTCIKGCS